MQITGSHVCFNCSGVTDWYANYSRETVGSVGSVHMLPREKTLASIAFVSNDKIQVVLKCKNCRENNIFSKNI